VLNLFKGKSSILQESIDRVLVDMERCNPGTDDYDTLLANLERLVRLQNEEKTNRVSPDTIAVVCANLLGILIIVGYEHGHVVASRGLAFILKTRHQ
jgi:hypothetical protein